MNLPLRAFWGLNAKISKLRAEEHLDRLDFALVTGAGSSTEALETYQAAMRERMGIPMVVIEIEDPDQHLRGIQELAGLAGSY